MPWSKLDDGFHEHPKTVAMSDKAFRLFVCSVTYSSRHKLAGRLTQPHLAVLFRLTGAKQKQVEELVNLRSFDIDGDGYLIHGFNEYNPDQEELSRKRADAGKAGAKVRWQNGKSMASATANASDADSKPMAKGSTRGGYPEPDPSPEPESRTQIPSLSTSARPSASRGTRLEKPFVLPAKWQEFAERERPQFDALLEGQKFANYWHGVVGTRGTKLDWEATWHNFVWSDMYGRGQGVKNGTGGRGRTIEDFKREMGEDLRAQGIYPDG